MFGNIAANGPVRPSTGVGGMTSAPGAANTSAQQNQPLQGFFDTAGGMGAMTQPYKGPMPGAAPPAAPAPTSTGNMPNMFGNMPPLQDLAPGAIGKIQNWQPSGGQSGMIAQIMAQMHPQATQALKSIPPQALQQLHQAGLIHPALYGHITGSQR